MEQDVGQEVGRERQVLVEHRHVEAGVLLRGERVHLAADRVDRPGDVLGRPGLGALEDQVLDEVGDPAQVGGLVAAPGVDPHPHGDRANVRDPLRDEPDPVGEDRLAVPAALQALTAGPITRAPEERPAAQSR